MFFLLLAGLLMAFAFQLLLTNLGVALGLSALGWAISPRGGSSSAPASANQLQSIDKQSENDRVGSSDELAKDGEGIPPVSHLVGLGVTLTLAPILFATAFLSVTFSDITQLSAGLIFGLILWAAYLLILIWISSITVSGVLDFVLGTATAGIRRLFSAVEKTFLPDNSSSELSAQKDLQRTLERFSTAIKQTLADQQEQLPALLTQERETLLAEICDRTSLTQDQAESVLEGIQLEAEPERDPTEETKATDVTTSDVSVESAQSKQPTVEIAQMLPNWRDLLRSAVGRIDTSDLDLETAWNTFQNFVDDSEVAPFNIIELDAENYLKESPVDLLQAERLSEEFAERIYDPEADPTVVEKQLQALSHSEFYSWLQQRDDLSAEAVEEVAKKLIDVRENVLEIVKSKVKQKPVLEAEPQVAKSAEERAEIERAIAELEKKLIAYFRYTALSKLSAQSVEEKVRSQLEEFSSMSDIGTRGNINPDFSPVIEVISKRKGIAKKQKRELTAALSAAWEKHRIDSPTNSLFHKVTDYLQSVDWSEADLEDFKDEVFQQVQSAIVSSAGLSQSIDPGRLIASLSVPVSVKNDLLALIKTSGNALIKYPRRWVERATDSSQDWGEHLSHQLGQYLQRQDITSKPEAIVQDASQILAATAQSIPIDKVPELEADFWQQVVVHRKDLKPGDVQVITSGLSKAWQSTIETLPQIKAQLETQSAEQWQGVQSAVHSLTHLVSDDVLEPVKDAISEFDERLNLDEVLVPAKQKFLEAVESAQDGIKQQSALAAQALQEKAEQVRHQVAIALWWLFISLLTSGAAAGAGGWLAVWVSLKSGG